MNNSQARAQHFEIATQLRAEAAQRRVLREAARVATDEPDIVTDKEGPPAPPARPSVD